MGNDQRLRREGFINQLHFPNGSLKFRLKKKHKEFQVDAIFFLTPELLYELTLWTGSH